MIRNSLLVSDMEKKIFENLPKGPIRACCQWTVLIEESHDGVIEELRRMHFLDEEREENQTRYKIVHDERSRLLDALSKDTVKDHARTTLTFSFFYQIGVAWKNAQDQIRSEIRDLKFPTLHVRPVDDSLCVYAETMKLALHRKLRLFHHSLDYHQSCTRSFSSLHSKVAPNLSQLLQCDNILQKKIFFKKATPFLENQIKEICSYSKQFLSNNILGSSIQPMPESSFNTCFTELSNLLSGDLLGERPISSSDLPASEPPSSEENSENTVKAPAFPRPIDFQTFLSLPIPPAISLEYELNTGGKPMRLKSKGVVKKNPTQVPPAPTEERKERFEASVPNLPKPVDLPKPVELPKPVGKRPTTRQSQAQFRPNPRGRPRFPKPSPRIIGFPNGRPGIQGSAAGFMGLPQGYPPFANPRPRVTNITNAYPSFPGNIPPFMGLPNENHPFPSFGPPPGHYPPQGFGFPMPRNQYMAQMQQFTEMPMLPPMVQMPAGLLEFPRQRQRVGQDGHAWNPMQTHRNIEYPANSQYGPAAQYGLPGQYGQRFQVPYNEYSAVPQQNLQDPGQGRIAFRIQNKQLIEVPEMSVYPVPSLEPEHIPYPRVNLEERTAFVIKNNRIIEVPDNGFAPRANEDGRIPFRIKNNQIVDMSGDSFTPRVDDGTIAYHMRNNQIVQVPRGFPLQTQDLLGMNANPLYDVTPGPVPRAKRNRKQRD